MAVENRVVIANRFLIVLIVLRLLAPPGICLCLSGAPAVRCVLFLLTGSKELPPGGEHDGDDHEPGCPASPLASALGLVPAPVLVPLLSACVLLAAVPLAHLAQSTLDVPAICASPPPVPSLGLTDCTLLI